MALQRERNYEAVDQVERFEIESYGDAKYAECFKG